MLLSFVIIWDLVERHVVYVKSWKETPCEKNGASAPRTVPSTPPSPPLESQFMKWSYFMLMVVMVEVIGAVPILLIVPKGYEYKPFLMSGVG